MLSRVTSNLPVLNFHSFRSRVVHGFQRYFGGDTRARNVDREARGQDICRALFGARHVAHADRGPQVMPVCTRRQETNDFAISQDRFIVIEDQSV